MSLPTGKPVWLPDCVKCARFLLLPPSFVGLSCMADRGEGDGKRKHKENAGSRDSSGDGSAEEDSNATHPRELQESSLPSAFSALMTGSASVSKQTKDAKTLQKRRLDAAPKRAVHMAGPHLFPTMYTCIVCALSREIVAAAPSGADDADDASDRDDASAGSNVM